jgi:hypothetical protein
MRGDATGLRVRNGYLYQLSPPNTHTKVRHSATCILWHVSRTSRRCFGDLAERYGAQLEDLSRQMLHSVKLNLEVRAGGRCLLASKPLAYMLAARIPQTLQRYGNC